MSILRNDLQVALNNLHVALIASDEDYRDAAEFVSDSAVKELFMQLAESRQVLEKSVAVAIRASDDLPSVPDPDRQTGQHLLQRLEAAFSADQTVEVIEQRLAEESQLEQLLNDDDMSVIDKEFPSLRSECKASIKEAKEKLERAKAG
ncbi:MAG: hypothetical protein CMK70_03760 [Pseudohongiella sp.]|nr:hypothetical protein [Pseudohongiella sp.]